MDQKMKWKQDCSSGQTAKLRCAVPVTFGDPMIGERGDSLMVTLRLLHPRSGHTADSESWHIRRTGFSQLWNLIFLVKRTTQCGHTTSPEEIRLNPGQNTISGFGGFGDEGKPDWANGPLICLTTGNRAARWRALISILEGQKSLHQCLLRGAGCCMSCAIMQAARQEGCFYLVL